MKQFGLVSAMFLTSMGLTFATDYEVSVYDFQFTPRTINARVGDTITWIWRPGAMEHTTTSVRVPAGAAAWSRPLDAEYPWFRYLITVQGVYHYRCDIHRTLMKGVIRVSDDSGAQE